MYYIGIDIAKQNHMAACRLSDGTPHGKAFGFANDESGFRFLLGRLDELGAGVDDSLVVCSEFDCCCWAVVSSANTGPSSCSSAERPPELEDDGMPLGVDGMV